MSARKIWIICSRNFGSSPPERPAFPSLAGRNNRPRNTPAGVIPQRTLTGAALEKFAKLASKNNAFLNEMRENDPQVADSARVRTSNVIHARATVSLGGYADVGFAGYFRLDCRRSHGVVGGSAAAGDRRGPLPAAD